jgi:hypothetical protein
MHGSGNAQVILSDSELYALIRIAVNDLDWDKGDIGVEALALPSGAYYSIDLDWFNALQLDFATPERVIHILSACFRKDNDFALYIENLTALHRRRVKYKRILETQPIPNMDQIGPRVLLEYGQTNITLLANWMVWRKWIYDIDNRSAQETGYLFEPLLASCLGGKPVSAQSSPVKRLDRNGKPGSKGRQIDCLVPAKNTVYELKLRVTIAASGQGRFGEELSFAEESKAAGYKPVLLVLDPTESSRLKELSKKFIECGGDFYHGEDAWRHMEEEAGETISVFVEKYIQPAIANVNALDLSSPESLSIEWKEGQVTISLSEKNYVISREIERS